MIRYGYCSLRLFIIIYLILSGPSHLLPCRRSHKELWVNIARASPAFPRRRAIRGLFKEHKKEASGWCGGVVHFQNRFNFVGTINCSWPAGQYKKTIIKRLALELHFAKWIFLWSRTRLDFTLIAASSGYWSASAFVAPYYYTWRYKAYMIIWIC